MSDVREGIDWLYSLGKFGIKLGLSNTRALMEISGNPHEGAKGVHIAGTNGKGSVAAMLTSILNSAGYRPGTYTSPHLVDFRERISVGGDPIPERELADLIDDFRQKASVLNEKGIYPTFFEVLTSMAFTYFGNNADVWVIETGMGGRLDSTNITAFRTGVITSVGMDHMKHLGDSIEKIAREKDGIIKEGMSTITAAEGDALRVIENRATEKGATVIALDRDISVEVLSMDIHGTELRIESVNDEYHAEIPLAGRHQARNAALAVAAAEMLRHDDIYIEKSAIISGLERTEWPGRFELVNRGPDVIIDAAHNLPGAVSLAETLKDTGLWGEYTLVLGILDDKDAEGVVSTLSEGASEIIITEPEYGERAMKTEELLRITERYARAEGIGNPGDAVESAMERGNPVLVTGSIYLLGDVLSSVNFNNRKRKKFD